jgi:hypothetical protein
MCNYNVNDVKLVFKVDVGYLSRSEAKEKIKNLIKEYSQNINFD